MKRRVVWAVLVPLLVLAIVVGLIIGIGEILLNIRAATGQVLAPVILALILTVAVALVATFLAATGPRPRSTPGGHQ